MTGPFLPQGECDLQSNRVWNAIRIGIWAVAGLIVLFAVIFTVTVVALPGCSVCHDSASFQTQTHASAHANVDCVRCHASAGIPHRITYAYTLLMGQVLHLAPTNGGPNTAIPDSTCLSCHEAVMQQQVTANGLSILHAECAKGRMCTDCHSDTAHGTEVKWAKTPTMDECLDCHNTERVRSNCNMCHAPKSEQALFQSGQWAVTHGPDWKQAHGMGDLNTCVACHPANYCVRCHGIPLPHGSGFIRDHPALAFTNRADCTVCHQQSFCDSCHGLPMPHPVGFTPEHPAIVKQQGTSKCLRCHVQQDCTKCHDAHVHPGGATTPPRAVTK